MNSSPPLVYSGKEPPQVVSVVIPAYDAAAYIQECLSSVACQAVDAALDIIVIDDGSTDQTAAIAESVNGVRVLRQSVNRGPGFARNQGIAAARGECVAFLDADDLWPQGALAARLKVLQRHPDAALVFGDCRQFDEAGPREQTEFLANGLGTAAWGQGELVPDPYWGLLDQNYITTGSVLVRKAVLNQVGGFANDLRLVEDLDLWLRIAHRHAIAWCGQLCLLRRRHAANLSRDAQAMSRAYLSVLARQQQALAPVPPGVSVRFAALRATELRHMAETALAAGDFNAAANSARQSLAARWHWRTAATLVQAKLMARRREGITPRRHG